MYLIAETADDLQRMLDALKVYCEANKLEVNVSKTKIMIFHKGRLPKVDVEYEFHYAGQVLEVVGSFCYLGFWLTVQLSYSKHLETLIARARARIGLLFAKLPLAHVPLHLALKVFSVYIEPLFKYGLCIWTSQVSNSAFQALDAMWTKFLKRYLCLPPSANNATVLFITNQQPLSINMKKQAPQCLGGLNFPESFSGMKLSFLESFRPTPEQFDPIPKVPSVFWSTPVIRNIPINKFYRKRLMRDVFDLDHFEICNNNNFHPHSEFCKFCYEHAHSYHIKYCKFINH